MKSKLSIPKHLSREAATLFETTAKLYGIEDPIGRKHLEMACEALDRIREAQKLLKLQGLTTRDRNGIIRPHPAATIERNARAAYVSAFKLLKLEPEATP